MKVPLHSSQNQPLSNNSFGSFCFGKKKGSFLVCENQMTTSTTFSYNELEIIFAHIRV